MLATFRSLSSILLEWSETRPAAHAFTFLRDGEQSEEIVTYGELQVRSARIAERLTPARGRPVVLLLAPGNDYIAALLGCFMSGAIAVPAYPPLSRRMLPRIRSILSDCDAAFVIASAETKQLAAEVVDRGTTWL